MRQLVITALLLIAMTAFGATAASAGCCAPKCKQHTCTKMCAPKCNPCKVECCKPKCEPVCKPKCMPCKPMPKCKPMVKPCYCCPFSYTIKPFGYDIPCAMPPAGHPEIMSMDHPEEWEMGHHGHHWDGHPGEMPEELRKTDAPVE